MNKIIVALALALASSLALAQTWGNQDSGAQGSHKSRAERMKNELDLSDEQVKKMREIRDSGGTREEMQAVLTPEQRVKAAQLRKERKDEQAARKARMQKELGLSDEQQAKLEDIRKSGGSREEMRAVLTPEQQAKFDQMRKDPKTAGRPATSSWAKPAAHAPAVKPSAAPSAATPTEGSPAQPAVTPSGKSSAETPASPKN